MEKTAAQIEMEWVCPVCGAENATAYEPEDRATVENYGTEAGCDVCGAVALVTADGEARELHT